MGPAARLARNAFGGAVRNALPALLALAVTPFTLVVLGEERFGLWALAGVVLSLARVLDLGLQRAMVREVALSPAGDRSAAVPALAAGRAAMSTIGLAYVAVIWLLRDVLVVDLLRLPVDLQTEGRLVLVGTAAVAGTEALFVAYQSALDGIGRMDVSSAVDASQRVLSSLAVVAVLLAGWGLAGLVAKNLVAAVAAGLCYRRALARRSPELAAVPFRHDRRHLRRLLGFGRHIQTVNASMLVLEVAAKVTIGRGPGLAAVAAFELAWRVVSQIGGALLGATTAVFPAAAERFARRPEASDSRSTVLPLYAAASRYLSWVTLPAYGLVMALAVPFVTAWVGPGRTDVAWAMTVLAAGFLVGVLAGPAHMVAQASGREWISSTAGASTLGAAVAAWALLVPTRGLQGAVSGVGLGVATGGLVAWSLFALALGTGRSTVGCLGARGPAFAALGALTAWRLGGALPPTWPGLVVSAAFGLAVYAAAMWAGGAMGPYERGLLASMVGLSSGGPGAPGGDSSTAGSSTGPAGGGRGCPDGSERSDREGRGR